MRAAIVLALSVALHMAPASAQVPLSCANPFIGEAIAPNGLGVQRPGVTFSAATAETVPGDMGVFFQYRNTATDPKAGDPMCVMDESSSGITVADICPQMLSVFTTPGFTCAELEAAFGSGGGSGEGVTPTISALQVVEFAPLALEVNGNDAFDAGGVPILTDAMGTFDVTLPGGTHCVAYVLSNEVTMEANCIQLPVVSQEITSMC